MADITVYGDISRATAGYYWKKLLERAIPPIVTEPFAQTKPMEKNQGKTIIFSRYNSLAVPTAPLAEGVTPRASKPTITRIPAVIEQYGDWCQITDVVQDIAEDPVLSEYKDILAEQMKELREVLNITILKSGTSVHRANNVALRNLIQTFPTKGEFDKVSRALAAQKARYHTEILEGKPKYNTFPVSAAYVALCHTDLKADLERVSGWIPVAEYASPSERLHVQEAGSIGDMRFILSPLFTAWADSGAVDATRITTTPGLGCDVYPIIVLAKDAWATIPLRGANVGQPMVINPNTPSKSDPMGQRGSVAWKYWHTGVILNDNYMYRMEVSATLNPV